MAHKILITDGVVLAKRGVGEAHSSVALLTKEAGLVRARATSARSVKSKLRYGLEPFTQARYSLVRGKQEWKVVGVERISREITFADTPARAAAGRAGRLLLRLVVGEEASPALFDDAILGFALLARCRSKRDTENLECMLVLRILCHLGYVGSSGPIEQFIVGQLSADLAQSAAPFRPMLIKAINESLAATGL